MSFREKSAWINFVLLLAFGIYFGNVAAHLLDPARSHANYLQLFVLLVVAIVVLEIITHAVIAFRSPREARTPIDERERLIELRSTRPAFYVLLVGAFLSVGTIHMGASTWVLAHCVLFAIWIAELTRYGSQLYHYRRGA
jgi:H+/Cl- antiporter ClcA